MSCTTKFSRYGNTGLVGTGNTGKGKRGGKREEKGERKGRVFR
jgi:hypothetical protein